MSDTFHIDELKNRFGERNSFSQDELHEFYKEFESDLKRSTLRWRIYELKNKGVLKSVKRGWYTLDPKKEWKPEITDELKKIYDSVRDEFPYLEFCIWTTRWLVSFSHHLPVKYLTILETERDTWISVIHYIMENSEQTLQIEPGENEQKSYLRWYNSNITVKTLTSQAPLMETESIKTPKLEKIIIDLYADNYPFEAFQGSELITIYENIFNRYSINWSTLKRYALRRNKWDEFRDYLKNWNFDNAMIKEL